MKKILIILVAIIISTLVGCSFIENNIKPVFEDNADSKLTSGNETNKNLTTNDTEYLTDTRYTTLYYQTADGLLVPITRKTARIEGIARGALLSLVDAPVIREDVCQLGLHPVLPSSSTVKGLTIKEGTAVVDFNSYLLNDTNETRKKSIFNAIVYTLTEFSTVERVQILVEGKKYADFEDSNNIEQLFIRKGINNDDIMNMQDDSNKECFEIYFTKLINNKHMYLIPISKVIDRPINDIDRYKTMLNELIKAEFGDKQLKTYIPSELGVKEIQIDGETVILDFDDEIINVADSDEDFNILLKQILASFKQFSKVKKIKINVNGNSLDLPGENAGKDTLDVPQYINLLL